MQERLYGLDALRGLAALVVLAMHTFGFSGGHLAVDFFFLMSGYLMARTYESRLQSGRLTATGFLLKRYRRLWPTMALGASLGFLFFLFLDGPSWELWRVYAFALLMIPAGATVPYFLNLPAWSIFYEVLANYLHGLSFARANDRRLYVLLAVLSAAFIVGYAIIGFPRILERSSVAAQLFVIPRALVSYLIGVLFYRRFADASPLRVPLFFSIGLFFGYIALVSYAPFPLWPLPFMFLVAPLMLCSGVGENRRLPVLGLLGDLSFPLYATHYAIFGIAAYLDLGIFTLVAAWGGAIGVAAAVLTLPGALRTIKPWGRAKMVA